MDMLMQEYAGMPVIGWAALGLFVVFIGYKVVKSKGRKRSGGGGGGGGGGRGNQTHRH